MVRHNGVKQELSVLQDRPAHIIPATDVGPGTRLGVYEVTSPIGEGRMGQVYRATDAKLKRQVAIRVLPPSLAADVDRRARFQREAEMLASLNHPNIAAIYGLEQADGLHDLVLEPAEGETLAERLERGGALPANEALRIVRQTVEALGAAHEKGWSERICREESNNDSVLRLT